VARWGERAHRDSPRIADYSHIENGILGARAGGEGRVWWRR